MGYCWNSVDEPALMTGPKPLLTELGIHQRFVSCEYNGMRKTPVVQSTTFSSLMFDNKYSAPTTSYQTPESTTTTYTTTTTQYKPPRTTTQYKPPKTTTKYRPPKQTTKKYRKKKPKTTTYRPPTTTTTATTSDALGSRFEPGSRSLYKKWC